MPLSATVIMLATVVVTVATHNLAYGVILGVIVAMVFFARRVAHFTEVVDVAHPDENTRIYAVRGALVLRLQQRSGLPVRLRRRPAEHHHRPVRLPDLRLLHRRALDAIELKYHQRGKNVQIIGLNDPSLDWHGRLSGKLGAGH